MQPPLNETLIVCIYTAPLIVLFASSATIHKAQFEICIVMSDGLKILNLTIKDILILYPFMNSYTVLFIYCAKVPIKMK